MERKHGYFFELGTPNVKGLWPFYPETSGFWPFGPHVVWHWGLQLFNALGYLETFHSPEGVFFRKRRGVTWGAWDPLNRGFFGVGPHSHQSWFSNNARKLGRGSQRVPETPVYGKSVFSPGKWGQHKGGPPPKKSWWETTRGNSRTCVKQFFGANSDFSKNEVTIWYPKTVCETGEFLNNWARSGTPESFILLSRLWGGPPEPEKERTWVHRSAIFSPPRYKKTHVSPKGG